MAKSYLFDKSREDWSRFNNSHVVVYIYIGGYTDKPISINQIGSPPGYLSNVSSCHDVE